MVREFIKRCGISFTISAICGLTINLLIDVIVSSITGNPFTSMSPLYTGRFATPVIAAYINILLYGVIGATFAGMTVIYESRKIGAILQNVIYFLSTAAVWAVITTFVWQLHRYPAALISTISGYAATYVLLAVIRYRQLKKDVSQINSVLPEE